MAKKIVVTGGKGGVGKTTFVAFLGRALAERGRKTLLVDMDFGLNNLDVLMGIENKIVYDIIDVIEGRCLARHAILEDFFDSNLFILPTIHGFCSKRFGASDLLEIISAVEGEFDFVLIDCPAGIDGGFSRAIGCGDEFIVITTPHLSAIRDGNKVISQLNCLSKGRPYLVVNRARGDLIIDKKMISIDGIKDGLNANLLGVVPEDDAISKQLLFGGVLEDNCASRISIEMICDNLIFGSEKIYDCTKRYRGLIGIVRKKLRRKV